MQIIDGQSIADFLNYSNIKAEFIRFLIAPQLVKYYFKINSKDIKKALKLEQELKNWAGVKFSASNEDGFLILTTPTPRRELVKITDFKNINKGKYEVIIGRSTEGENIVKTLDDLTHLLVAGTTGAGKSVFLNSALMGLCCYNSPEDLGIILIDLKKVEFAKFAKLPHLLEEVITEPQEAEGVLEWLLELMEQRYLKLSEIGRVKNSGEFKKIVVIIDELADLIIKNKNVKTLLIKLLQKGRASGIHFILATQSPRASILDGLLLANLPSRLALTCASARESTLILGHKGAEQLTGRGDAIIKTPDSIAELRVQVPLITEEQIQKLINH